MQDKRFKYNIEQDEQESLNIATGLYISDLVYQENMMRCDSSGWNRDFVVVKSTEVHMMNQLTTVVNWW